MRRDTLTITDDCPRCFGRGALYIGRRWTLHVCPECRGTGSAVVQKYADWRVGMEREEIALMLVSEFPELAKMIRERGAQGIDPEQRPTHCFCGALLLGSDTQHAAGCSIREIIEAVTKNHFPKTQ